MGTATLRERIASFILGRPVGSAAHSPDARTSGPSGDDHSELVFSAEQPVHGDTDVETEDPRPVGLAQMQAELDRDANRVYQELLELDARTRDRVITMSQPVRVGPRAVRARMAIEEASRNRSANG